MFPIERRYGSVNHYSRQVWEAADKYDQLCRTNISVLRKRFLYDEYLNKYIGGRYMVTVRNMVKEIAWKIYLDDMENTRDENRLWSLKKNLVILGFRVY